MMNIIRADIYAMIRGKGLYITFGLIFLLNILMINAQGSGTVGIHFSDGALGVEMQELGFDGIRSVILLYTNMSNMMFFLLPLIILVSAPIFTHGTVKNDISWGISRTKLYLSKLCTAITLCIIMVLFYMGTGMGIATILNGWGGVAPNGYWTNLFQTVGTQTLLLMAMTAIGVFFVFTFKRTSIVMGAFIVFCFAPGFAIALLVDAGLFFTQMMDFDLMLGIMRLGYLSQLETNSILSLLMVGVFYILVTTIGGITLFKRAEIK
ncbi:MAG: hypothetical protein FWE14_03575 [Lachnospiraceae bacterium]|nr:hypothetical protein [Lachnospiraceae bacterium]